MGRRSDRFAKRRAAMVLEHTDARESLERRWYKRLSEDESLARLVTGADLSREPYHRWLPYTQGFSPALVRRFIAQAPIDQRAATAILDPFAGSGTTAIEAARAGLAGVGVEALPAVAYLGHVAVSEPAFPALPDLRGCKTWRDAAPRLTEPVHRAALMLAVAHRCTRAGRRRADAPPLPQAFNAVVKMIREDQRSALAPGSDVIAGDARSLEAIDDESVGGALTSPPYLSRHDYARITRPMRKVYAAFVEADAAADAADEPGADLPADTLEITEESLPAHPGAATDTRGAASLAAELHASVAETYAALLTRNQRSNAALVVDYFAGLREFAQSLARVMRPGAPAWVVIGGARVSEIYVPSDLIFADIAATAGFDVAGVVIARRLIAVGRKLGMLTDVAPRESVVMLRRS
ncbi:MAG: hypothetical protein SF069_04840 [Phycisphaerae bacterium]|nr:hypothetical protein [Phycisphaerae bacterium]